LFVLRQDATHRLGILRIDRLGILGIDRPPVEVTLAPPGREIKVSRHAALQADAVGPTAVGERATQIMLPTAQQSLEETPGRFVQGAILLRLLVH